MESHSEDPNEAKHTTPRSVALENSLARLRAITVRMRTLGLAAFMATAWNAVTMVFILASGRGVYSAAILYAASISPTVMVMAVLVNYDFYRKRGEVLFEEISEEIQWWVSYGDKKTADREPTRNKSGSIPLSQGGAPELHARIVLREFARTTELPLVSSKNGAGTYAAFNLVITGLTMSVISMQGPWHP